jgi:hypothetical protein
MAREGVVGGGIIAEEEERVARARKMMARMESSSRTAHMATTASSDSYAVEGKKNFEGENGGSGSSAVAHGCRHVGLGPHVSGRAVTAEDPRRKMEWGAKAKVACGSVVSL